MSKKQQKKGNKPFQKKKGNGGQKKDFDRKPGDKPFRKDGRPGDNSPEEDKAYGGNHPAWYNPNQVLYDQVTRIPFGYRLGDSIPGRASNVQIPGVMVLDTELTAGYANAFNDPINQAIAALYSWINKNTGRTPNYKSADLMFRFLAMDSIVAMFAHLQRVYSVTNYYNMRSRYAPKRLIEAMGISFDDLPSEINQLRLALNNIAIQLQTIAIPATFPLFSRHAFMYGNVFKDVESDTANLILCKPSRVYKFTRTADYVPQLQVFGWINPGVTKTWKEAVQGLQECLNALYNDEDTGLISADVLKTWGPENIVKFGLIPEGLAIEPVYDPQFLNQIHNASVLCVNNLDTNNVDQVLVETATSLDTYVTCQPSISLSGGSAEADELLVANWTNDQILDYHVPVDNDSIMVGTRLTTLGEVNSTGQRINMKAAGQEFVLKCTIYTLSGQFNYPNVTAGVETEIAESAEVWEYTTMHMQFSHAPLLWHYNWFFQDNDLGTMLLCANTDNVASLDYHELNNLHNCARLGLYDVARIFSRTEKK